MQRLQALLIDAAVVRYLRSAEDPASGQVQKMGHRLDGAFCQKINTLAGLYVDQGQYAQAEPLFRRALAINEKSLGPDHPAVAKSVNSLAVLYTNQGQYTQAEPLYKRALAIREKTLGPNHHAVAASLENLAVLYRDTKRVAEAVRLEQLAAKIRAISS